MWVLGWTPCAKRSFFDDERIFMEGRFVFRVKCFEYSAFLMVGALRGSFFLSSQATMLECCLACDSFA